MKRSITLLLTAVLGLSDAFAPDLLGYHHPRTTIANTVVLHAASNGLLDGGWTKERRNDKDVAVIEPDFKIASSLAMIGSAILLLDGGSSLSGVSGGLFHILLGAATAYQANRIRCVFEKDGIEFYKLEKGKLVPKNPNFQTGLSNRWSYGKITNYGFFPSKDFPVIAYFKETQTPEEQWDKNFAAFDSYGGGQPHLFPAIFDVKKFTEEIELRVGKKSS